MSELDISAGPPTSIGLDLPLRGPAWRYSRASFAISLVLIDALAIVGSGMLVDAGMLHLWGLPSDFAKASVGAFLFFAVVYHWLGGYQPLEAQSSASICRRTALSWGLSLLKLILVAFLLKVGSQYSRLGAACFALVGLVAIMAAHLVMARYVGRRVKTRAIAFARLQLIALEPAAGESTSGHAAAWSPPAGFDVTARYSLDPTADDFAEQCRQVRVAVQRAIGEHNCDQILVAAPWQDRDHVQALLAELGPLAASVALLLDPKLSGLSRQRRLLLGDRIGFELQSAPLGWIDRKTKRAMDVCVAASALVLLSPVMLLATAAIWLETGRPILFCQDRRGFGGIPFKIMKFRSMTVTENGRDIPQARRGDARITGVGSFLRRTSVDELPQLINVLRGEMSIVGPRPHAMAHDDYYDQFIEHYAFRHHVKPGITGWAQVNGHRGATETPDAMQARLDCDLWYINHWSFWLDVKIIFMTAFKILADKNAY